MLYLTEGRRLRLNGRPSFGYAKEAPGLDYAKKPYNTPTGAPASPVAVIALVIATKSNSPLRTAFSPIAKLRKSIILGRLPGSLLHLPVFCHD